MIWVLTVKVGMCIGMWCTVDVKAGFSTWEDCSRERDAIVRTVNHPSDYVIVAQCSPEVKE